MKKKSFIFNLILALLAVLLLGACGQSDEIASMQAQIDSLQEELNTLKEGAPDTEAPTAENTAVAAVSTPEVQLNPTNANGNFREAHGALKVKDGKLLDQNGAPIRLYGMSTHGISKFPQFVTEETFRTLRDDFGTNCVRLALYTAEDAGYCTNGDRSMINNYVLNGINHATNLGMYVIVDWHILSDGNPNIYKEQAKEFFTWVSSSYGGYTNIIYEICNEPNGAGSWSEVKAYADEIIPVIRNNDPDAVILVGTPNWCQDIESALNDPLPYENIMYTMHFYAATHKDSLRRHLIKCADAGLPIFVSEFGTCEASGNGFNDFDSAREWLDALDKYNISCMCWNLANKDESSSIISASSDAVSGWSDNELKESGKWIRDYFRSLK